MFKCIIFRKARRAACKGSKSRSLDTPTLEVGYLPNYLGPYGLLVIAGLRQRRGCSILTARGSKLQIHLNK